MFHLTVLVSLVQQDGAGGAGRACSGCCCQYLHLTLCLVAVLVWGLLAAWVLLPGHTTSAPDSLPQPAFRNATDRFTSLLLRDSHRSDKNENSFCSLPDIFDLCSDSAVGSSF